MISNKILKEIMMHRQRVSLKMSSIANDLAANGRRHDNSYTGDVELNLINKIAAETDPDEKLHYKELLDSIHSENNDYCPDYHKGISGMNMIQLIEYLSELVVRIEERQDGTSLTDMKKEIQDSTGPLSDDMRNVINNTIEYIVDRNKAILKSLNKQVESQVAKDALKNATVDKSEDGLNYGA